MARAVRATGWCGSRCAARSRCSAARSGPTTHTPRWGCSAVPRCWRSSWWRPAGSGSASPATPGRRARSPATTPTPYVGWRRRVPSTGSTRRRPRPGSAGLLDAVADTMTRTPARVQPQRRPVGHVHRVDGRRRPARRRGGQPAGRGPRRAARRRPAHGRAAGARPRRSRPRRRRGHAVGGVRPRLLAPGTAERRHRAAPGRRRLADARPAAPRAGARPHRAQSATSSPTCSSTAWVPCSRSASTSSGRAGCGPSSSRGRRSTRCAGTSSADDRPVRPRGDVRVRLAAGPGHRVR